MLDGRDAESFSAQAMMSWRSRVGFVPQDHGLVPNVRVLRNVLAGRVGEAGFFRSLRDVLAPKREALMEIHELLERLGIGDLLYRRTDTLSGGEQQRLAIARALYQRPEALLADEPLASVDPARALDLLDLLQSVATERGLTLVVSLHNLDLARSHFPRLVGLRDGSVQFDGPPASLADDQIDDLYRLASSHEDS